MRAFHIIGLDGTPYLSRYTLFTTRWGSLRVHHIRRSDEDPELHDHPWAFLTCILWGGYWEIQPDVCQNCETAQWRRPGTVLYRPASHAHRLILRKPAWTLVWTFPVEREWGFHTMCGWQHWRTFISKKFGHKPICED